MKTYRKEGLGSILKQELLEENNALKKEIRDLKARLMEAEELQRAISEGDLDALVIPRPEGELIFTLDSADRAYRALVETMNEGTATLGFDGTILYCNHRFAELLRTHPQSIVGKSIFQFVAPESKFKFNSLLKHKMNTDEVNFQTEEGRSLPVYLSVSSLQAEHSPNAWCLVVTDLTEQKKNEEIIAADRLTRSIIEQAAETIVVCDTSGRIIRSSSSMAKLCDCDPAFQRFEDLINLRFSKGAHEGEGILPITSALKGSTVKCTEVIFEAGDGQKSYLLLNSGPLKNESGEIIACVVTLNDITERKRVEKELQQSRDTLKAVIDAAPVSIVVVQADGGIFMENANTQLILGGPVTGDAHGPTGGYSLAMLDGSPVPAGQLPLSLALEGKTVTNTELLVIREDSTQAIILVSATPLNKDHGKPWGAITVLQDITERKQLEEQTRQRAEELELVMEVTPAIILTGHDPQSHNITGNRTANEFYGAEAGENVSASVTNVRHYFREGYELTADELPMQEASLKDIDIVNAEYDVLSPGGECRTLLGSASPLHDAEGHVRGSVGAFIDITERKVAESKLKDTLDNLDKLVKERTSDLEKAYNSLKESERRLTEAQKMAHIGSWDWSIAANESYWSDETYRIIGLNPQEFEATYSMFLNFVHPDDRDYVGDAVNGALNGKPFDIDFRVISVHGEERIVHEHGEVVFDGNNIPLRMMGTVQDITERKLAEEFLAKIEIARKQEIHHRIKNNLQVISSLLDLQAEQFKNKECIKDSEVLEAFRNSQDRVISMTLIHEELYKGGGFDTLNFSP